MDDRLYAGSIIAMTATVACVMLLGIFYLIRDCFDFFGTKKILRGIRRRGRTIEIPASDGPTLEVSLDEGKTWKPLLNKFRASPLPGQSDVEKLFAEVQIVDDPQSEEEMTPHDNSAIGRAISDLEFVLDVNADLDDGNIVHVLKQRDAAMVLNTTPRILRDWESDECWPENARTELGYDIGLIRKYRQAIKTACDENLALRQQARLKRKQAEIEIKSADLELLQLQHSVPDRVKEILQDQATERMAEIVNKCGPK